MLTLLLPGAALADLHSHCSHPAPCYSQSFTLYLLQRHLSHPNPLCPSSRGIMEWGVSFGPFLHHHTNYQMFSPPLLSICELPLEITEGSPNHHSSIKGGYTPQGSMLGCCCKHLAATPSIQNLPWTMPWTMTPYKSLEIGPTFGHLHPNHQLLLFFALAVEKKLYCTWGGG